VSTIEEEAAKVHIDVGARSSGRAPTSVIVTTRANAGGAQAVQWSLPG